MNKRYFAIHLNNGRMAITAGTDLESVKKKALARYGTDNVKSVKEAVQSQVSWVRAMGGKVPPLINEQPK